MTNTTIPSTPVLIEDLGMMYATPTSKSRVRFGIYLCLCNTEFKTTISGVNRGHTKSCGCLHKAITSKRSKTHGFRNHRLYDTWRNMLSRCNNKSSDRYKDYGARGITVCERWLSIGNFIEDMYPSYEDGLSLDRIENNKSYYPENCRWTTNEVQGRNSRELCTTNTSGYRGVSWDKHANKWKVKITVNTKQISLGRYEDKTEAAKVYNSYVIEHTLEHTLNTIKDIQ